MTSNHPVRAVTFDCAGTLIQPWPSVGAVYALAGERCGYRGLDADELNRRFGLVWSGLRRFDYTRRAWFEVVRETMKGLVETADMDRYFIEAYDGFARAGAWRVHSDVRPCLEVLQRLKIRMAVVSNFDERLSPLLRELGLAGFFEVIVASGPLGIHKPAAEIFHHACRQLGVAPEQTLHVGDRFEEDLTGAREAGLRGILLNRTGSGRGDREGLQGSDGIRTLAELVGKLGSDSLV